MSRDHLAQLGVARRRSARARRRRRATCRSGTRRRRPPPCAARAGPSRSAASSGSQRAPQITLMTFQPAPRKSVSSSWMILPLPRTGPSRRCRLQLTTKIEVVEPLARRRARSRRATPARPSRRRRGTPTPCARAVSAMPRPCEVLHEARLVDRHDRAEAHRDGRELPEVRHQPRVRVRRQPCRRGRDLLAEARAAAPRSGGPRGTRARRCRARSGPGCRRGRRRGCRSARARSG